MTNQEHGYEHSQPFDSGIVPVGAIHKLHYEQYGRVDGKPAMFLHGGPGGSTSKESTVFFNPNEYRVVLFDQRGAGKSTPSGELHENTSHHLTTDIETLRKHLNITKWHLVFGGSWGSALSLLYAQTHPEVVGSIIVRGVHTCRNHEYAWSRGSNGAARIYPDAYEAFLSPLPEQDRQDPILGYYKLLTSADEEIKLAAAREWNRWDLTLSYIEPNEQTFAKLDDSKWILEHARMESHYFSHGAWLEEGQLLKSENIDRIRHIPTTIVQGRYDIITPPRTAWDLYRAFPEATLHWVPGAGHSVKDRGVQTKLTEVCDEHAKL